MLTLMRTISLFTIILLSACDGAGRVPTTPGAVVGTRANIKMHGQDVVAEVTQVIDKLVTMEFRDWQGGVLREVNLYRGLFPIGGVDGGQTAGFWASIEVVGENTIALKDGPKRTMVVEIEWEFKWKGVTRRKTDTIYFDPESSMILKSVIRADNYQNYWVVVSVDEPDRPSGLPARPQQQRRSGTVMI